MNCIRAGIGILLALLAQEQVHAQLRNANWLTGGIWVSFVSGVPLHLTDVPLTNPEAAISDSTGELKLYMSYGDTNGIRSPDHALIANQPPSWSFSTSLVSTQASIFIPRPGHPSEAFLCKHYQDATPGSEDRRIGIIRLHQGATGVDPAVLEPGFTWFMYNAMQKRMAVPHANGMDYWFVSQGVGGDSFMAYVVGENGITDPPVESEAGSALPADMTHGKMIPNSTGDRFVSVSEPRTHQIDAPVASIIELFTFDRSSGAVEFVESIPDLLRVKGVEFSPSGRFLYVVDSEWEPSLRRSLYQYDLTAPDIPASRVLVHMYEPPWGNILSSVNVLALSPDGRIYAALESGEFHLGVINAPDAPAPDCSYVHEGFAIPYTWVSLPALIKSYHDDPGITLQASVEPSAVILRVQPNPVTDELRLTGIPRTGQLLLVRDALGRVASTKSRPFISLDVHALTQGMYTVEVRGEQGAHLGSVRFIKE